MTTRRIVRRVVLPTVWVLIGATIAVSLAVLAFGGGTAGHDDSLTPTATQQSPTVTVGRESIENSLEIGGTIVIDPPVAVTSPDTGTVSHVHVPNGAKVAKGAPLFELRTLVEPDPGTSDEDEEPPAPVVRYVTVTAPATGRLTGFATPVGEEVAQDATVASIRRQTFTARGTIEALQRYRLLDPPGEATVTIAGGPEPFTCDDLTIADAATTAEAPDPEEGGEESSGTTSVRCDVPRDVKVFDGLAMTMRIDAGATEDALVVPVTAVRGLLDHGTVWVMADDGTPAERAVELGVNDGKVIEVTKGLDEGEEVLQYVPGSGPEDELGGDLMYAEEL